MGDLSNPFGMEYPKPLREGEEAKNWGLILHGKGDVRKEPRAFPDDPPAGQVQINVKMCGICGSDVHTFETGNMVGFPLQLPLVLGHEASGVITKVGPGVDNLKVGQAVAIHPWTAFGLLTTHINHPAMLCFPLPEGVDFRGGAYVEPLAVGLNAVRRANVGAGTNVAVLGAGPVGIASLVSAKAIGARKVVVTDLSDSRLEIAKANGADVVLNVKGMKPAEVATALAAAFKTTEAGKVDPMGLGWSLGELTSEIDAVVDAAGFADTVAAAVMAVKPKGSISIVGLGAASPGIPLMAAAIKEVNICPAFAYGESGYADALQLLADEKVDIDKLVSHVLSMDEGNRGFDICLELKDGSVKVMFDTEK